ncbi:MAG: PDZ domain-containing protein [Planctomycetota bacterium]
MKIVNTFALVMVLFGSSAVAQEGYDGTFAFVDQTVVNAGENKAEYDLYVNSLPAFSHKAHANQNCSNCHTTPAENAANTDDRTAELIGVDFSRYLTQVGLELGKCRVEILNDEILRGHLNLEAPAFLVRHSEFEGKAGLMKGDVILKIGGKEAKDPIATRARLIELRDAGEVQRVEVEAIRAGKKRTLDLLVAELTPPQEPLRIGVQLEAPSEALRSQLQLFENEGAIVTNVIEDSPAERVGIQEHDILLRADDSRLSDLEDLREAVQASDGKPIHMVVMRGGKEVELDVVAEREDTQPQLTWCPGTQFNLESDGVRWFVSPESNSIRTGYYFDPHTYQPNTETWSRIYLDDYSARFADLIEEERLLNDGKDSDDDGNDSDGFKDKKEE